MNFALWLDLKPESEIQSLLCFLCTADMQLRTISRGSSNGPSESVQYDLVARRYADTPSRRYPTFVVAALPRCDLLFNPLIFVLKVRLSSGR